MLAVRDPAIDVRAVTVVAGNVPLDLAVRNAIVTLDICGGADIPVFAGRDRPLHRPLDTAQWVHGQDGMGGAPLPEPSRLAGTRGCGAVLLDIAERSGRHDLVTIGPLTNIAAALEHDPSFLTKFGHTYLMAGSPDGVGNVDALGEYNVWADPEAAALVFAAAGRKTMIGWNISRTFAVLDPDEQATARRGRVRSATSPCRSTATSTSTASTPASLDSTCPIRSRWPSRSTTRSSRSRPRNGSSSASTGRPAAARSPTAATCRPEPNIRVVWSIDEAAFKRRLFDACTG